MSAQFPKTCLWWQAAWLLATVFLLGACSTQPHKQTGASNQLIEAWQCKGKLAVTLNNQVEQHRNKKNYTARFSWQKQQQAYLITLTAPLGLGSVIIEKHPPLVKQHTVSLYRGAQLDNAQLIDTANNANELFYRQTNLELPVNMLEYWITGQAAPNQPARAIPSTPAQPIAGFKQAGWTVEFSKFTNLNNRSLPRKVKASKGSYKIIIAIYEWALI